MEHYGLLSLLPPLIAIALSFLTRQVIPSLLAAIWIGATIINGWNPIAGFGDTFVTFVTGSLADKWKAGIIIFSVALGGMIGVTVKTGGAKAIAEWFGKKAKNPRGGQLATWAMGLVIFFDDYSNTLLVGNTMRPLTDKLRISREKLSYICDSTAAPVANMALISTWVAFEMGLIKDAYTAIGVNANIYGAFLTSIPFRFYSITTLVFVLAIALYNRDFGPMLKAEKRARAGKVISDDAAPMASKELTEMEIKPGTPIRMINAIVPVLVVVFGVLIGLYVNGKGTIIGGEDTDLIARVKASPFAFDSIRDIIGNADASVAMTWAAFAGSIVAVFMTISQRILSLREAVEAWIDGAKSMMLASVVLLLAWGIGSLCEKMGTATYLVGLLQDALPLSLIPLLIFLLCCMIAFATGTSWGTAAIMMPIAVPLAFKLGAPIDGSIIAATIGAVFAGAVFGDHCSPISDTTVMSSMACASDHMDHVKTQIPYAVTTAGISIVFGYFLMMLNVPVMIILIICTALAFFAVRFLGKSADSEIVQQSTSGEMAAEVAN